MLQSLATGRSPQPRRGPRWDELLHFSKLQTSLTGCDLLIPPIGWETRGRLASVGRREGRIEIDGTRSNWPLPLNRLLPCVHSPARVTWSSVFFSGVTTRRRSFSRWTSSMRWFPVPITSSRSSTMGCCDPTDRVSTMMAIRRQMDPPSQCCCLDLFTTNLSVALNGLAVATKASSVARALKLRHVDLC